MKKINMTKYGFERWPERDFSDDGSRFTCYKAGNIEVSKTTWNGEAFISARGTSFVVPYEVYSALPHYKDLDKLNGVPISAITDDDLFDLYEACVAYGKELAEAEAQVVFPTVDEIKTQCKKVRAHYAEQVKALEDTMKDNAFNILVNMSEYEIGKLKDWLKSIKKRAEGYDPDTYPNTIYKKAYSFDFVKPTFYDLTEDWYFREAKDIIKKYI